MIGVAVVVTSSCNERALVVLRVDKVDRKVGGSVEETKNVTEDVFFAIGVEGSGRDLRLVEIAECAVCGSSGATVLIDERKVGRVLAFEEGTDQGVNFGTEVNVSWEVGFSVVCFLIRVERT